MRLSFAFMQQCNISNQAAASKPETVVAAHLTDVQFFSQKNKRGRIESPPLFVKNYRARKKSTKRSPIITEGAVVFPETSFGMIDVSATRSPSIP